MSTRGGVQQTVYYDPANPTENRVWNEGDPFPGALNQDQQQEVTGTGNAYWLFRDTFGRDSYDGAGHTMTTVNKPITKPITVF